jgi:hypothetical protein
MTQPVSTIPSVVAPTYPMVVHMISNPMFPGEREVDANGQLTGRVGKEEPIHWVVSKPHPFVANFNVLRMFMDRGSVEVYSVSADNARGMRDVVPMHCVRLVQEAMPMDIFVEELEAAENDDDEDDLDLEPGEPGAPAPPPAPEPPPAASPQAS